LFSIFDAAEAAPNYALRKLPNAELYRTIGIVTPAQAGARARAATLALDARFSVALAGMTKDRESHTRTLLRGPSARWVVLYINDMGNCLS
jgi:hypothetical protein